MSDAKQTVSCLGSGTTVGCSERGAKRSCPRCGQTVATTGFNALRRTAKIGKHQRPVD